MNFLRIMEEVIPIGPDDWEQMTTLQSTTYPGRTSVSIRRKYHDLHRVKVPAGDPDCPDDVRMVKRVKYAIGNRAEVGSGEETYDLEAGVFKVEERLQVGEAGNTHITNIGGDQTARGDREDMDADPIPPAV